MTAEFLFSGLGPGAACSSGGPLGSCTTRSSGSWLGNRGLPFSCTCSHHTSKVVCKADCTTGALGQALAPARPGGRCAAAVGWCALGRCTMRIGGRAVHQALPEQTVPSGLKGSVQTGQAVVRTSARMGASSWTGCMCIATAQAVQVCDRRFVENSCRVPAALP